MHIPFTCRDLIIARAVAHSVTGCEYLVGLGAEEGVWERHRRRTLTAEQWLDLVLDEIEALT